MAHGLRKQENVADMLGVNQTAPALQLPVVFCPQEQPAYADFEALMGYPADGKPLKIIKG